MLNLLYQILILIGTTIIAVLTYLWWQARSASQLNLALIRLNEQKQFDVPLFLQNVWPLLKESGLRGFVWQLNWYGVVLKGEHGNRDGKEIVREIAISEMTVIVYFYQKQRGEKRYFDTTLIETVMLLLHTDMWIKAGSVDSTISQMAKLTLFLEHDMKNVAQFIQLMSDQLEMVTPDKEAQLLSYLSRAAPMIRQRADHIVKTLTMSQAQEEMATIVSVDEVLHRLCHFYQLEYNLQGQASVLLLENTFENALENILKNYQDMPSNDAGKKPFVQCIITSNEHDIQISITSNNTAPAEHLERLFEPFWTNNSDGLGIGLYQAKHMLEKCNASISAAKSATGQVLFTIQIPL